MDEPSKPRVLFVDDDPCVTDALRRALSQEPIELLTANNASQALGLLVQHQVDVVVADERMPGMSGTDLLIRVRRDFPSTIRIVLTGHASLEMTTKAMNEGQIHRLFTKPCKVSDLLAAIRDTMGQRRPEDAAGPMAA